jgi:hypothetical protein
VFTLYRLLLYLYPPVHRREYGDEMTAVFLEASADPGTKPYARRAAFYLREITGLLRGAFHEQIRFRSDAGWLAPRRFAMRSEFRFPKSTTALMSVILAGVILAIEKGKAVQASLPFTHPRLPPIRSMPPTFPQAIGIMFAAVYLVAIAAWAILFAFGRSGIHRISELSVEPGQK